MAVNHLEGHAVSARLAADIPYPFLLLLVSGGHCQLLSVDGVGACTRMGGTIDDAAGEAFDKIAKTLGLPTSAVTKGKVTTNANVAVILGQDYKPSSS